MIGLLPLTKVLRYVAISYAVLAFAVFLLLKRFGPEQSVGDTFGIALGGGTLLEIALLAIGHVLWRKIWKLFPSLNSRFFPDLNGEWDIVIDWQWRGKHGQVEGDAVIKQNLIHLSMDVRTTVSSSKTMMALPRRSLVSGNPELYYIYEVTPHAVGARVAQPYRGAAILDFHEGGPSGHELSGNYWTSSPSTGRFQLTRKAV